MPSYTATQTPGDAAPQLHPFCSSSSTPSRNLLWACSAPGAGALGQPSGQVREVGLGLFPPSSSRKGGRATTPPGPARPGCSWRSAGTPPSTSPNFSHRARPSPSPSDRRALAPAPPRASRQPLAALPLPPPTQQINTTFYEKKINSSDVTHLWEGRARARRPVWWARGSHAALRRADTRRVRGHTRRHAHTPHPRAVSPEPQSSPGPRSRLPGREGACGRVWLRWGCARACVSVCLCAAVDTASPGSGSPGQEAGATATAGAAGGQGWGRLAPRTQSLHMEEAFLDD
ncbi:cuticle collagen bli-1 [Cavia porcellus]|uniref:cuticle collagen bli-1 n=1 Tax=Cavia porcellus TaxID=10141 RepID=UPI002FE09820